MKRSIFEQSCEISRKPELFSKPSGFLLISSKKFGKIIDFSRIYAILVFEIHIGIRGGA